MSFFSLFSFYSNGIYYEPDCKNGPGRWWLLLRLVASIIIFEFWVFLENWFAWNWPVRHQAIFFLQYLDKILMGKKSTKYIFILSTKSNFVLNTKKLNVGVLEKSFWSFLFLFVCKCCILCRISAFWITRYLATISFIRPDTVQVIIGVVRRLYYYIIFHHLYPVDDFYDSVIGPDYQSI